ncbi:MAG: serine hydroxymethyltransferase [bacterium]
MDTLGSKIRDLSRRLIENNLWRQRSCFNLIPSETTPTLLVKLCEISDPAGRYAEHRTMKGKEIYFYQGTDFIRDIEEEARRAICEYFRCEEAELRPISGQMANEVVFKAMVKFLASQDKNKADRMRLVMNNDLTKGGHLSSQPMGALFNYVEVDPQTGKEAVLNFPVRKDNPYKIDAERMVELIEQAKPDLIVFGKSMFLSKEPVKEASEAASKIEPRPVIMYDMAHVLGLYGAFQRPLEEGADILTGSTHKTFFGPQRGVVVSNMGKQHPLRKLWIEIKGRAFPGSTSNHHLGTLVGLLLATYEMLEFKEQYQTQVRANAKAFAKALKSYRLDVEGDPSEGYTETHQVIIRVRKYGTGEEIARRLEENNIICNYQALPDDESFIESSGIRTGVQEMTRFGMVEADFDHLAALMADVVIRNRNVKEDVISYRKKFSDMRYCLPIEETCSIAAKIMESIFPNMGYAQMFADNLRDLFR